MGIISPRIDHGSGNDLVHDGIIAVSIHIVGQFAREHFEESDTQTIDIRSGIHTPGVLDLLRAHV